MEAAVWGVIGTIVGAGTSIATTYLTNRNAATLQSNANSVQRLENQRAFQRQTLLEIQDAFHDSIRLFARAHLEQVADFKRSGTWGRGMLPDEINEDLRLANRKVGLLLERVADDTVRETVKVVMAEANTILLAESREDSGALLNNLTISGNVAIARMGKLFRTLC
jgi:hypothetical protein